MTTTCRGTREKYNKTLQRTGRDGPLSIDVMRRIDICMLREQTMGPVSGIVFLVEIVSIPVYNF